MGMQSTWYLPVILAWPPSTNARLENSICAPGPLAGAGQRPPSTDPLGRISTPAEA